MQFDLRKFIATGRQPYHAEFQCDLSAHDYAGARIPQPVTAVFEAEWTAKERDLDDPDFELPLDEKGHLDVDEWLAQEFMFQIPTVLLCSADCPGLCPRCGKKRAECTCPPEEDKAAPVDARLAILKSLLN